jgi:hypothetical protein
MDALALDKWFNQPTKPNVYVNIATEIIVGKIFNSYKRYFCNTSMLQKYRKCQEIKYAEAFPCKEKVHVF